MNFDLLPREKTIKVPKSPIKSIFCPKENHKKNKRLCKTIEKAVKDRKKAMEDHDR